MRSPGLLIGLLLLLSCVAAAQELKFRTVLQHREALALSSQQVEQIEGKLQGLEQRARELQAKKKAGARLVLELTRQEAALEDIRKALQVVANLEVEARLDDLATARAIGRILTREQRGRWVELQKSP